MRLLSIPLVLVFLLEAREAPAQALDRNAVSLGREAIDLINRGDSAQVAGFVKARLSSIALTRQPAGEYVRLLLDIRRQSGGVVARAVEPLGSGVAFTLWARNANRGSLLFVAPDRQDSTRITRLAVFRFFHPAAHVRELPPASRDRAALLGALRRELDRLTKEGEFSGTVAIARGDTMLFEEGYGRAVQPDGEPNGAATRYHLASVGKMFTAVAIGQLVEGRRLSLDDSIGKLLPQWHWPTRSRGITVRQLLSHTSGLGQSERAGEAIDSTFVATPPAFTPGSRFSYSNDGYELLGLIIERITGQSYQDYAREHVLQPGGMSQTDAYPADQPLAHRAIGYGHRDDDYFGSQPTVPHTDKVRGRGTAAGGSYGTAGDLVRFGNALSSGKLLRRAMLDTLTTPRWPLPGPYPDQWYGYGFETHEVKGERVAGHGGGGTGWGICADVAILPGLGYSIAVLTNLDPPECSEVSRAIVAALAGKEKASGKR